MSGGYQVHRFGQEREPIVVIDDFPCDFDGLCADAIAQNYAPNGPFYPGLRAPASAGYLGAGGAVIEAVLRDVFNIQTGISVAECNYSLVTTAPQDLKLIQKLPHYDGVEPGRLAVLHYLRGQERGGTAFYRHRASGYETVTAGRFDDYRQRLAVEYERYGPSYDGYVYGDSDQFEMIGEIKARENRLIIYRGITLHSGVIADPARLSIDPAKGRLTVNTFFQKR